ncbi:MAG: Gfo/Idh/MocA family oxidoreductase [Candidatus Handelsmanbacteria bacterium]|nr:Gfo/Idh/MocA family oxidoreductase [Candidatus Handelsmanbacteria bacterium]
MSLRIGFIGTGGIAGHHLRTLAQLPDATLAAFCDVVPSKARAAADTYGGKAYGDFRQMFDSEHLDAVYICLPPFAHGEPELEALGRGLPIFVEKPVATTADAADQIQAAIEEAGLISAVGYHWRYMDLTARARERLAGQEVGFALGSWAGGMPGVSWWRVMEQSGGQIVEQTTHIFDLARYLLGEVRSVHAACRTGLMKEVEHYNVHDATVTNLSFASGAIASITSACMLGTGGHVGLDLYLKDQVLRLDHRYLTVEKSEGKEIFYLGNNPTFDEDAAFLKAVQSGDPSGIRCPYAEAVKTLKLTLAATRSASENRVINL